MSKAKMVSESFPRCENCGLRLEDEGSTGPLCKSCAYRRKKQEQRAAAEAQAPTEASGPPPGPDVTELRERLRRVEEGLRE
jgi:tRNA(Ile2) C34 agmatinyltransferase TiaS